MSAVSLLRKPRKTKKSKSLNDLSSNKIGVALSDSQKSILQVASNNKKRSFPSIPQMKRDGRKLVPNRCSDNNLVYMFKTADRCV
ncbi:hypothetical protein EB796_016001 [Bugula neritina]|uniref:Uncharacterized protein n=1 Tax=Bugula neritina TaxID=10212 RepID=A0A7J7JHK5_BUGNE|nr:hypothetical protein EB796_016001 [Bugula neritina]